MKTEKISPLDERFSAAKIEHAITTLENFIASHEKEKKQSAFEKTFSFAKELIVKAFSREKHAKKRKEKIIILPEGLASIISGKDLHCFTRKGIA